MSQESIPAEPILFTPEELALLGDEQFFRAKARIMTKMKAIVEGVYDGLQRELAGVTLLAPAGFSPKSHQFVKGEHLEDFPYQYLDYFKHFRGEEKFTFRTLLWWGHHIVFALILEGGHLIQYKKNLMTRYGGVADQGLALCLRSEEHTSELQSHSDLVCRLLLEKKKISHANHCADRHH